MHPPSTKRVQAPNLVHLSALALAISLIVLPGVAHAQSAPSPAPSATTQSQGGTTTSTGGGGTPPVPHTAPFSRMPVIELTPDLTEPVYIPNSQPQAGKQYVVGTAPSKPLIPNTNNESGATDTYQDLDVGGLIRLPVFRWVSLGLDRQIGGTLDQTAVGNGADTVKNTAAGPVLVPSGTNAQLIGSGNSRDEVLLYHAIFTPVAHVAVDIGDAFRHRMDADDGSGVSATPLYLTDGHFDTPYGTVASTEAHYGFIAATYTTPPIRELHGLTLAFTEQGAAQNVDHHVGDALICTTGNIGLINDYAYTTDNEPHLICPGVGKEAYIDENPSKTRWYTSTETVTANLPLSRGRNSANFIVTETTGVLNWYENYPVPFKWASQTSATVSKRFNSVFSLAIRYRQQVEDVDGSFFIPSGTSANAVSAIGTPYAYPSAQRVGSVDVIGTFHIDTNTLFH